jgi:hypothetical protein
MVAKPMAISAQQFYDLSDLSDQFEVFTPSANQFVKGTINISFRAFDDEKSNIEYSIKLYDIQTCSNTNYGTISSGMAPSNATQNFNASWNTKTTQSTSNLNDGDYCLRICLTLLDGTTPYSACNSRGVTIINNNLPPVISSSPSKLSFHEGETFQYQIVAADPNNDVLTYRFVTTASFLTINAQSGLITSTPLSTLGNPGLGYSIVVAVDDGKGGVATQSFNLEILKKPVVVQPTPTPQPTPQPTPTPTPQPTPTPIPGSSPKPTPTPVPTPTPTDEDFKFVFPGKGSEIKTEEVIVKWVIKNTSDIKNLSLEFSKDQQNWEAIGDTFEPTRSYYVWDLSNLQDGNYFLRLNIEKLNGQKISEQSEQFIVNLSNIGTPVQSIPLIINIRPENDSQISSEFKTAISGEFLPSKDQKIKAETFTIRVDGRDFKENCTIDEASFLCNPKEQLSEGRHLVVVTIEDTSSQKAENEWTFSITTGAVVDDEDDEIVATTGETINILGREIARSAALLILIICCIALLLLFIPWILYGLWTKRNGEERIQTVYGDPLSTDNLQPLMAYSQPEYIQPYSDTTIPEVQPYTYVPEPVYQPVQTEIQQPQVDYSQPTQQIDVSKLDIPQYDLNAIQPIQPTDQQSQVQPDPNIPQQDQNYVEPEATS